MSEFRHCKMSSLELPGLNRSL